MMLLLAASGTEKDTDFLREKKYGNFLGFPGKVTVSVPPVGQLGSGCKAVVMSAI